MKRLTMAFYRYVKYLRIIGRVVIKKPLLIFRILNNYFRIFILKEKIVRKVEMGVTFDCQCNCQKCSSGFMEDNGREKLTLEEIRKVAKEIVSLGAIHINLTGGEPLLAEDLFEVIRSFSPNKVLITINTNGLLLNEEMIDRLEAAGVDILKISIDSPIPEEHDKSRGYDGCFEQAERALSYIRQKKKIWGQISTVCIKENLRSDRVWKLVNMAKDYNALLGLNIPAASGRWLGKKEVLLDEEEKKILKKLIKIPHVIRDTEEAYIRSHCPVGSEEFYLTCYGDIIPCPLVQISFGNTKKESVKTIWERMSDFKEFKDNRTPGCLAAESKDFIERYLLPLKGYRHLPVPIEEHPQNRKDSRY